MPERTEFDRTHFDKTLVEPEAVCALGPSPTPPLPADAALHPAAPANSANGSTGVTVDTHWDCNCERNYIHPKGEDCAVCGPYDADSHPDSHAAEVINGPTGWAITEMLDDEEEFKAMIEPDTGGIRLLFVDEFATFNRFMSGKTALRLARLILQADAIYNQGPSANVSGQCAELLKEVTA